MKLSPTPYSRITRRARSGFTLIELLLVMVILAILAGVVVPKYVGYSAKAKVDAAKTQIDAFKSALGTFETQNDRFPTNQEGLQALVSNPGSLPNWVKGLDSVPQDPWGHPYIYRFPGSNGRDFDLISCGPDGVEGGSDDITN